MTDRTEKRCPTCQEVKPVEMFYVVKSRPDGRAAHCKKCSWEREKKNRENNPKRVQQLKESYERNKEKIYANKKAKYYENHEASLKRIRDSYVANRENRIEYSKQYRLAHLDEAADWQAQHRTNNPEKHKQYEVTRSSKDERKQYQRKMGARRKQMERDAKKSATHTNVEWMKLCAKYEFKCLKCGRDDVDLTKDHIVPYTDGGTDALDNVQPLCASCNSSKGSRTIDYRPKEGA